MDEQLPDDRLRALRDADPANRVEAPPALRDRIVGLPTRDAPAAPVPLKPRRRWILPAAAAAAVIAALGGGYAWGTGGIDFGPAPVPMAVETGTPEDPAAPIGGFTGWTPARAVAQWSLSR